VSSGLGLNIKGDEGLGYWIGELPVGCRLCFNGSKSVLFITGLCAERCFYCPISSDRRFRDVVFINEVEVKGRNDLLCEVAASLSQGVGITGGEPLEVLDRVLWAIKSLKDVFGSKFHIHLYTSGYKLDMKTLSLLENAGLDEIRVHITSQRSLNALRIALNSSLDVVVENPVLPGESARLLELIKELDSIGVKYVNLNELEVSDLNLQPFLLRGLKINPDGRSVAGSREVAMYIINQVRDLGMDISVHYCPAAYKDLHQYRMRLSRRARGTRRVFEDVVDGLVRWLELELGSKLVEELWVKDLAIRTYEGFITHHKLSKLVRSGRIIEALPLTPRKPLNEFPLNEFLNDEEADSTL